MSKCVLTFPCYVFISCSPLADRPLLTAHVVPPASLGYQPSTELEAFINAHLRDTATAAPLGDSAKSTPTLSIKTENPEIMAEGEPPLGALFP